MANRGPLASVLIVDPVFVGRGENANGTGAAAMPPMASGDGAGTAAGALAGNVVWTVADLLTGFYSADANGANRTCTLPSFADLTNGTTGLLKGIGDSFTFALANVGAANNLVVTGVANVTVLAADAGDATVAAGHYCTVELRRISNTACVAAVTLFQ